MYYLIEEKPINLPYLMLSQIKEAAEKCRACLPYGMVFTLIFQEFIIDCNRENARRLLYTDRYNECSLHYMDYNKIDDLGFVQFLVRELLLLIVQMRMMMITRRRQSSPAAPSVDTQDAKTFTSQTSAQPMSPRILPPPSTSIEVSANQFFQFIYLITSRIRSIFTNLR